MPFLHQFKRPLQWLVALIALAFLARVLAGSWSELQSHPFAFEPLTLAVSFIVLMVTLGAAVWPWQRSLRWLGVPLSFGAAARIWFLSNAVRYVPGNIWQPVTMVVMARARGVAEMRTATSIALNWILSNLSALLVAALYWSLDPASAARERLWLVPMIVLAALGALHPVVLRRALTLALKAARRTDAPVTLSFGQAIFLLVFHSIIWIGHGIAFAIFWRALAPLDGRDVPRLIGVFAAAYAIGFLSLLTPSGLGVREGALVFFLSGGYPAATVTVIALLSRLWLIVGELLCTLLTLVAVRGQDA